MLVFLLLGTGIQSQFSTTLHVLI